MAKYLVETLSVFRIRYVVEAKSLEHAYDEVVMGMGSGDLAEFSQKHVTESIMGGREVTDEEFIREFDADNDYLSKWTESQKFNCVNKITYED